MISAADLERATEPQILMAAMRAVSLPARFWAKTRHTESGCIEWTAAMSGSGYGVVRFARRNLAAHRVALALSGVVAPEPMVICHTCDNRKCVNPGHLYPGTLTDNINDRHAKAGPLPYRERRPDGYLRQSGGGK